MTASNSVKTVISSGLLIASSSLLFFLWNDLNNLEKIKTTHVKKSVEISSDINQLTTEINRNIPDISEYDEIIKRPLFNDDRLPFVYVAPEKTDSKKKKPVQKKPVAQYRLNAVVITPDKQIAIIQTGKKNEVKRVAIGESIDDWILDEVTDHAVQLKKGSEIKTLELEIKASTKNTQKGKKTEKKSSVNTKNTEPDSTENTNEKVIQTKKENI